MFLFLKMLMALALAMPRPAEDIVAPILPADDGAVAAAAAPSVVSSPIDGENKTVDSRYHHHHNGGFGAGAGYGSIFILISPAFIQVLIYCSSN